MSDLISRSELIDYFYYGIDDKPIIDGISDRKIIDIIKNQPTAYDIGKVVDELKNASWEETDISTVIYIDDAIEIVKHGGAADDVCEYKEQKNKFGSHRFITSCGKDLAQYGFMFEYNYCPYCGKKIRMVE